MNRLVALLTLLALSFVTGAAIAQDAGARVLSGFVVQDAAGEQATAEALAMEANWALLIVDADLPSAADLLSAVTAKDTVWENRITLLVLGDAANDLIKQLRDNPKLANARLFTAPDNAAVRALGLPGLPAAIGVRANREIAWVRTGVPTEAARIDAWLLAWTRAARAR